MRLSDCIMRGVKVRYVSLNICSKRRKGQSNLMETLVAVYAKSSQWRWDKKYPMALTLNIHSIDRAVFCRIDGETPLTKWLTT